MSETSSTTLNITPSPRILAVITNNPLSPINALCELIDNSIDAFFIAKDKGTPIDNPVVRVTLPTKKELEEGKGKILVEDNGPGLSLESARKAVTAGYSGNKNPIERLGLFGVGFNISTGKLGTVTILSSTKEKVQDGFSITIDLPEMVKNQSFDVPVELKTKENINEHFTRIEIKEWWSKGEQNYGFINKLVGIGKSNIREQLGRIYSTVIQKGITIMINEEVCEPYYHCVWLSKRYVTHPKFGKIPARYDINESLGTENRCLNCWNLVETNTENCPFCDTKESIKTIEKRVYGWVGIQRYDDKVNYGIDLIRNGRAIKVLEKESFFTWTHDSGEQEKDYPIDGVYGRIIGEIHIDYVPVNYLKTDFERTTNEWNEVIKLLRGESTLQPNKAKEHNESENNSPIYKLYQGYRRVRDFGTRDMYMGHWNPIESKPERISREEEKALIEKFKRNEPGYGPKDDSKWWELVEEADHRPIPEMKTCPECGVQFPENAETCSSCGYLWLKKKCIGCGKDIAQSASSCQFCGKEQEIVDDYKAWRCPECKKMNSPEYTECLKCHHPKGRPFMFSFDNLKENSHKKEELSSNSLSVPLPGGETMDSINLAVFYFNSSFHLTKNGLSLPVYTISEGNSFNVFIDPEHKAFTSLQVRPVDFVAVELAKYILDYNLSKINESTRPYWSISSLYFTILNNVWKNIVELNQQEIKNSIDNFLENLYSKLPIILSDISDNIHEDYTEDEKSKIVNSMLKSNVSLDEINKKFDSGDYLEYIPENFLINIIKKYPEKFFDGNFWEESYLKVDFTADQEVMKAYRENMLKKYINCLEDIVSYRNMRNQDINDTQKVSQSLKILTKNISN